MAKKRSSRDVSYVNSKPIKNMHLTKKSIVRFRGIRQSYCHSELLLEPECLCVDILGSFLSPRQGYGVRAHTKRFSDSRKAKFSYGPKPVIGRRKGGNTLLRLTPKAFRTIRPLLQKLEMQVWRVIFAI